MWEWSQNISLTTFEWVWSVWVIKRIKIVKPVPYSFAMSFPCHCAKSPPSQKDHQLSNWVIWMARSRDWPVHLPEERLVWDDPCKGPNLKRSKFSSKLQYFQNVSSTSTRNLQINRKITRKTASCGSYHFSAWARISVRCHTAIPNAKIECQQKRNAPFEPERTCEVCCAHRGYRTWRRAQQKCFNRLYV